MKRLSNILLILLMLCASGCLTKIYLGEPKREEQTNYLSDDSPILGAINPTTIPAGGTWGTVRGVINTNFSNINGSLDSIEVTTARHEADIDTLEQGYSDHTDSLAVHRIAIDGKISIADTAAMLNPYAKLSDLSEGGIGISAVQDEIADSLNALRANIVVGDGTKGPFFDGSADGGQTLTFYGDNGFWTALQGGAPVANRSYRLPIAALPGAGTTSLMNIDEYGNMGFAFNGIPATLTATELGYVDGVTSSIQNQLNAKVNASDTAAMLARYALLSEIGTGGDISTLEMRVDSIVDVLADSVNIEALLQIDFDSDTLAKLSDVRSLAGSGGSVDSSLYVTVTRLTDSLDVMRVLINDLIAVVENLGVDLSAPSIDSMEIGNFADDTLVIYFSEKLNTDSIPASSVFYLTEGANEMGIASISLPNDTVMYVVLDSTALYGSTYLLDYTRAHPYLQDSTGNAIATFSNRSVINNMPEPSATGLLEGLIAYWDMQESSGNIVDEVASLAGVPASTAPNYSQTGRISNAINFNYIPSYGSGTRFDVGDDLLQSNQVSISAWIYPTESGDAFTIISNNASGYGYRLFCGGGGGGVAAEVSDGSGHTAAVDAGTLTINTWHHVVLVVNGTNVTTYINGTQSDQEAFAYNIGYGSGSSVTIGATYDNSLSFGGRIDELGIWNRALTTDEIAALYNTGSGLSYSSFGN